MKNLSFKFSQVHFNPVTLEGKGGLFEKVDLKKRY